MLTRRKPIRSDIQRATQRSWPKHERWVRGFCCAVHGQACQGRIEFAHVRQGHSAGTGIKPPSWQGIPLCAEAHREQHQIGHQAFDRKYGIDSLKIAAELAAKSPDFQMHEAMNAATSITR